MSYPRKLHILIIEDEQDPIDGYRHLLETYRQEFPSVEPTIARSAADAREMIDSEHIFHLVILDLNLPLANKEQAPGNLEQGQLLLDLIARRHTHPIPALLVVSGRLNLTRLSAMQARLAQDFWYGAMVNKGPDVPDELKKGLQKAHEYVDIGIHIADAGKEWFPTLSPCEEDLLRRCVLSQRNCIGVDLEWWGAELGLSFSQPSLDAGPTKVLMGRFILDEAMELSRHTFFKFEPEGNAQTACRDVAILDQKLSHVKVKYSHATRGRCLLVTQSVTDSRPVPFDRFLGEDPASAQLHLPALMGDVAGQLIQLGRCNDDQVTVKELLWKHHDRTKLEKAWARPDIRQLLKAGSGNPLTIFDQLNQSSTKVWVTRRSCTHGDLNATNVAVDRSPERPKAFIFDAAGIHADVASRDFAVLEVTTLLFLGSPEILQHFQLFRAFYTESGLLPSAVDTIATLPPVVQNTFQLLTSIRTEVAKLTNPEVYPIVVFDTLMTQLGGLAGQSSKNKIANPILACLLSSWAAEWVQATCSQLLSA